MSDLTTDEIYKKITSAAIDKAKKELRQACDNFNKNIGLSGTCDKITVRADISGKDNWQSVQVRTDLFFNDLIESLIENRKESIKRKSVEEFLKSVETFKNQMAYLEQYNGEQNEI